MSIIYIIKYFAKKFIREVRFALFRCKWRKRNKHNFSSPNNVFPIDRVAVGEGTYGRFGVLFYGDKRATLSIGCFCSISSNVTFIIDGEHSMSRISSYPFRSMYCSETNRDSYTKGAITVGDDVWFGYGCTILSGVDIGQGAVVASGAVVSKNVPPYAIVAGVPARIIKYRFSNEIIEELLKVDYKKINKDFILNYIDDLEKIVKDKDDIEWIL